MFTYIQPIRDGQPGTSPKPEIKTFETLDEITNGDLKPSAYLSVGIEQTVTIHVSDVTGKQHTISLREREAEGIAEILTNFLRTRT